MSALVLASLLLTPPEPSASPRPEPVAAEPAPSEPAHGTGRLAAGPVAMGFGVMFAVIGAQGIDPKDLTPAPPALTGTLITLGVLSVLGGTISLLNGANANKRYNQWRKDTRYITAPDGSGRVAAGALVTGFGGAMMVVFGAASTNESVADIYPPALMLSVGGGVTAAGVGLLSWGLVRRKRYRQWRAETPLSTAALPYVVPLRRGVGVGLSGRF